MLFTPVDLSPPPVEKLPIKQLDLENCNFKIKMKTFSTKVWSHK